MKTFFKMASAVALGVGVFASAASAANPITTSFYSADAAALVYHDSLFIFAGHDEQGAQGTNNKFFLMNDWHVLVTDDMDKYHDYGAVLSFRTFKWASGNAFAGHCEYRNGKFYWYVAVHHATVKQDEGFSIGVAVADHPSGPWTDAIGHALVDDNTKNDVALNIDPAIFYDGNDIWMYWGSWNAGRRVKLKDNMIELASTPEDIKIKDFFEAPWMHKYRGNYYFSYASGYPSTTNYSMATSLNGPWTQKGVINDLEDNSETNHQAIFKYLGHWYFMHHGANSPGGWTYRRSVNIDYLYYDENANIVKVKRNSAGVDKVNNALVKNGGYRMTASHSDLALADENGIVVQRKADANAENQLWVLALSANKARHYTLQNFKTKNYYCPPTALLDTVKTKSTPCEIRIENASAVKGYYLYGDYDSDFVGDVLNVSKDDGMPVITWVRTGADNQKFKLAAAELPKEVSSSSVVPPASSSSSVNPASSETLPASSAVEPESSSMGSMNLRMASFAPGMRYDAATRTVYLSKPSKWIVFDMNGVAVRRGYGDAVQLNEFHPGQYVVRNETGLFNVRFR